MSRISLKELNQERLLNAVKRRVKSIPDKFTWSFSNQAKENRDRLKSFKNKHQGERCFLVANGPSLANMDLEFLRNETSFGLNRIYLAYDKMNFRNNYLVCINNLVLNQFKDDLQDLDIPKFINWQVRNEYRKSDNLFYVYKRFFGKPFGANLSKSINPAATVTYAALQVIFYMGFKEVIIIGMDHNFKTKEKNRPNKMEVRDEEEDENHFHPNYFPKGSKWETPDLVSSEYFYKKAREEFEKDGRRIIDCTINGQCTIFEKGNILNFIKGQTDSGYRS